MTNQLNNDIQKEFFNAIEPITHNYNFCSELFFQEGKLNKAIIFENGDLACCFENISTLNADPIISYLKSKITVNNIHTFENYVKNFLKDIEQRHNDLKITPDSIKIIMIFDIIDSNKVHLKHWTSFPVLDGNEDQINSYLEGIVQFGRIALSKNEVEILEKYIEKIGKKMLGE